MDESEDKTETIECQLQVVDLLEEILATLFILVGSVKRDIVCVSNLQRCFAIVEKLIPHFFLFTTLPAGAIVTLYDTIQVCSKDGTVPI